MTGVIVMIRLIRTRKREPVETERTGKYGDEGDDAPRIRTPAMTSGFSERGRGTDDKCRGQTSGLTEQRLTEDTPDDQARAGSERISRSGKDNSKKI